MIADKLLVCSPNGYDDQNFRHFPVVETLSIDRICR